MEVFYADGICSPQEAAWAVRIANMRCVAGSGYGGDKDPMNNGSVLKGVRVSGPPSRFDGELAPSERAFLVELLERMKMRIQEQDPSVLLRCGYASLTLREAQPGAKPGDLAHPMHADHDSYGERDTWRTHSAVLYLNDDFVGGEFCLAGETEGDGIALSPACGRMVGLDATQRHGVMAVAAGRRISLVGWYGAA